MKAAVFFLVTVFICLSLGAAQVLLDVKLPIWAGYALGAVFAAPAISLVSHWIDKKNRVNASAE